MNQHTNPRVSRTRGLLRGGAFALIMVCAPGPAANLVAIEHSPTPSLVLDDLDGQSHRLQDYRGRPVLLNFWATWCPPCVAEMPALQRLQNDYGVASLRVIAVSRQEHVRTLRHFRSRMGLDFLFLHDPDGALSSAWGVQLLPTSVLIDAAGRARYRVRGEVDWDATEVRATIDQLKAD